MIIEQHLDGGALEVVRLRRLAKSWLMEDMLLLELKRTSCGLLRIVAMVVHMGEHEDVDACMGRGCALFNTPRHSFPTGRPNNYGQLTMFGCSIFYSASSRAHSYCKKNT